MSRVDGNRIGQRPFNEVSAASAAVGLRVEQIARSAGTALVDHDGTGVGSIVIHANLRQGVASQHRGREHDTPVERTTSGQADSINVHTVVIIHPTGLSGFRLSVEGDVVDIEAVVTRGDDEVLSVFPLEGMVASGDGELALAPVAFTGVGTHLLTVDVEVAVVPTLFGGDLAEEAHLTVGRDVHGHLHGGGRTQHLLVAALHAVHAFIRILGGDDPRIGRVELPIEEAEVASLEGLDDFFTGQAAAPVDLHVRCLRIEAVRIILSDDGADGIEVLVKHIVDRAGGLVVVDGNRVALDGSVDGLIAILCSRTIVTTGIDVAAVVALVVGVEVVGVVDTKLVLTNHRHGGTSDASRAVLLVDVTVNVAVAGNLHGDRI